MANIITGGEHISPASLKRQEEVLPTAKLEQRRYNVLMERDPLHWIVLVGQIHLDVLRRLETEIQR